MKCKVKEMLDNECWVTLPNGARGFCNDLKQSLYNILFFSLALIVNFRENQERYCC